MPMAVSCHQSQTAVIQLPRSPGEAAAGCARFRVDPVAWALRHGRLSSASRAGTPRRNAKRLSIDAFRWLPPPLGVRISFSTSAAIRASMKSPVTRTDRRNDRDDEAQRADIRRI